jgi:hypothetical protein
MPSSRVRRGTFEVRRSGKTEAAALRRPDRDARVIRESLRSSLTPRRDPKQRALETRVVAGDEQLVGIVPGPPEPPVSRPVRRTRRQH